LPLAEALGYARQALSALAAAHELGIVHRDLKPQNLLLHRIEGYEPVLKVLDFGAARNLSADPAHATGLVTRTGTVIGSFQYLSPEGRAGRRVDLRADLYALALVCCAMLSGQPPSSELAGGAQLSARNLGLAAYVPDARLRAALEACLLRALASEPDARFASAPAFAEALPVLES
jgi:serine/threonine-protein kinase